MPLEYNKNKDTKLKQEKGLFVIQLKHTANSAYRQQSAAKLQAWHHATLGAPVVTTLIRAINNNWLTIFPGLTANGVQKHLPKSVMNLSIRCSFFRDLISVAMIVPTLLSSITITYRFPLADVCGKASV